MRVIGLMSGTSLDGIDAALVEFDEMDDAGGADGAVRWRKLAFAAVPYPAARRARIQRAILEGGAAELCRLHAELGEWLAEAALAVCRSAGVEPATVDLIGSHGQTVWHEPRVDGRRAATLQLGCPATIAERTGIPVVSDFRGRDAAAGGEGAPLVAWADRLLFSLPDRRRALQNIGGMANVTWLPALGSAESVLAFDTGPGVAPIDAAVELATGGRETYDRDGRRAARGRVDEAGLEALLAHPFFNAAPPKSTGRETFGRPFVESLVAARSPANAQEWADLVATVTALTARSIAAAYERWVLPRGVDEVVLTGGGAHNPVLREAIATALSPVPVRTAAELAMDGDAREAVAFAALAWAHARGLPANVPEATGAEGARTLGSYTPAGAPARPAGADVGAASGGVRKAAGAG
ncbi:MAG: anhydro-N-acetylmuramic acid kinase [Gemmatimonadota bacterium]